MTDYPKIFFDAICLLIADSSEFYKKIVLAAVEMYKEASKDNPAIRNENADLYLSILEMLLSPDVDITKKAERCSILMRHKDHPIMTASPQAFNQLSAIFMEEDPVSARRKTFIEKRLRNSIIWYRQRQMLGKMFAKNSTAANTQDPLDQDMLLNQVLEHAKDLVRSYDVGVGNVDDAIDSVDMSDPISISKAITIFENRKRTNTLRTGLQGLNRILGPNNGYNLGEFVVFAALSHNYKSGILKDHVRWLATLNNPSTCPPGMIPTILYISLEDETYQSLMDWYNAMYAHAYHKLPDESMSKEMIVSEVIQMFSKKGFTVLAERRIGETFGIEEFSALQTKLKQGGRHVMATIIDYVSLMKLPSEPGVASGNQASAIQKLFRFFKDFAHHSGQLVVTAAQLDARADELANSGVANVVKRFSANNLSDCKAIKKEADILIFLHIQENDDGVPYLTMRKDKHRGSPPSKNNYIAYRFSSIYGIMDDLAGEDQSILNIYNDSRPWDGNEEETVHIAGF